MDEGKSACLSGYGLVEIVFVVPGRVLGCAGETGREARAKEAKRVSTVSPS